MNIVIDETALEKVLHEYTKAILKSAFKENKSYVVYPRIDQIIQEIKHILYKARYQIVSEDKIVSHSKEEALEYLSRHPVNPTAIDVVKFIYDKPDVKPEPFSVGYPVIGTIKEGLVRGFYMRISETGKYIIVSPFYEDGQVVMKHVECESVKEDVEYIRNHL